jgi:hypothetical protein
MTPGMTTIPAGFVRNKTPTRSSRAFIGNHTIGEGTPAVEKDAADGKGLDHVSDWFPVIIGIYFEALAQ